MSASFSIEGILSSKKELEESVVTSKSNESVKSQSNSLKHLLSTIFPPSLPRHWIDILRQDRYPRRVGHPYQNRTPPKRKKPRTSFNRQQIMELERRFHRQKYLASSERCDLAKDLDMTDSQVKTWFQNRRTKWRRQTSEEREAERQAASRYLLTLQNEINQSNNPPFNYTSSTLSAISNLQPWAIPQIISEMSSETSSPVGQIDDSHSEK